MKREKKDVFKFKDSEKLGELAGLLSAFVNLSFALTKGGVALLSGSVSLFLDALNNLFDAVSGARAFLTFFLSHRNPPRAERIFDLGAYSVALWMMAAGIFGFSDALGAWLEPPEEAPNLSLLLLSVFLFLKLALGILQAILSKKLSHAALSLCAKDSFLDSVSGALLVLVTYFGARGMVRFDALLALGMSVSLFAFGFHGGRRALARLLSGGEETP